MRFEAVIFDLDGVITKTALVHGEAWKRMFDEFLKEWEQKHGEPFREFTHAEDYLPYVDGKPRYKGVASFLESRNINIPFGSPEDNPENETVCGLGNRKNLLFNRVLEEQGVEVYESTVTLVNALHKAGIRVGVASSSKNCRTVLERAGLLDLFETRIDGEVSAELGLKGKPEPDIFTTACDRLSANYSKSVIVEDAVSGVQAGRNGNFGLVLGLAREDNVKELYVNGADLVYTDLEGVTPETIEEWFSSGIEEDKWSLTYHDYDKEMERSRETLLTVGNGYFGTRGAMEESSANEVNYPGTYLSGLYNRLVSKVGDREIENEDFVNIPNWLPVKFKIGDGEWFEYGPDPSFRVRDIQRRLDFRNGELVRVLEVEDNEGRITRIRSSRFANMADQHVACLRYNITPVNYSSTITIRSELEGNHINAGVERYSSLNQKHLHHLSEITSGNRSLVRAQTTNSRVVIVLAAKHIIDGSEKLEDRVDCNCSRGKACQDYTIDIEEGREISFEKLVTIYTSQDRGVTIPRQEAWEKLDELKDYGSELKRSGKSWQKLWGKFDIAIGGDRKAQKLVRLHLYHILTTASEHSSNIDAGIPPRGLHGEAYRGHIFWDELYILPLYNLHLPEVTKAVLMYRYRRLHKARDNARQFGYEGAMFPWQSGSDGREETQVVHLNPLSGEWGDDYSSLQRHISIAIAFNVLSYYRVTGDRHFMVNWGAELLFDICKFWVSKTRFDKKSGKYHIDKVMGPDEFHEKLPGSGEGGLSDNAYTNIMVSWMLSRAISVAKELTVGELLCVMKKLHLESDTLEGWEKVMKNLFLNINGDGLIEQFSGYFGLKEIDWNEYSEKYKDLHRFDRILKAEGKSPDDYKVSKQADLLMAWFNLGERRVEDTIRSMGYKPIEDMLEKNLEYYLARTSHGSTLSRLVHSGLIYRHGDREMGFRMFREALESDLVDIQGGTTAEGIHAGVMAGTVYEVMSVFAGLDLSGDNISLDPMLPDLWDRVSFNITFRGDNLQIVIFTNKVEIFFHDDGNEEIMINICGEKYTIASGKTKQVRIK